MATQHFAPPTHPVGRNHSTSHAPIAIPRVLADADRWLNWRPGATKADNKFDKIPFDATTGTAINDKDPSTWRPLAACQGRGRLGFAVGDGFAMIDLDRVRNPRTGEISPQAQAIIDQAASYTEISPSGKGIKIFVLGALPHMVKAKIDATGGTIEIYSEKRFSTFTGRHLDGTPTEVVDIQPLLNELASRYAPPERERPRPAERMPVVLSSSLAELRQESLDIVTRLRAGRLDPLTFTALYNRLDKEINPAIKAAVPAAFNAAYTVDSVLEDHGCVLESTSAAASYYGGVPGDRHSHTISLMVKDGRVKALSTNSRLWNEKGHDAFSAYTILAHDGNTKKAQTAAADLLAPLAPHASVPTPTPPAASPPEPELTPTSTPEQRQTWADAKAHQREHQRTQITAMHMAAMDHANADPQLLDRKGHGNIGFVVLMVLLDSMGTRDWCRPAVSTMAQQIGCCVGHVRRGLALLEGRYIQSESHVNKATGELWSGGPDGATRKRTLCDLRGKAITTPQTTETGRSSQIDDDRHVLITRSHASDENNQQARAVLLPTALPVDQVEPQAESLKAGPTVIEPVVIEGGASFDPAAALPLVERPYTGRAKAHLGQHAEWAAVEQAYVEYQRLHPQPEPVDQVDEPEQQPLIAEAPKPKRRRSRRSSSSDPRKLEGQIIALERKAANIARTKPKQAWALRHEADAKRSELSMLAERGDAELELTDPTLAEMPQDRARLLVISEEPGAHDSQVDTPAAVPVGRLPNVAEQIRISRMAGARIKQRYAEQEVSHAT